MYIFIFLYIYIILHFWESRMCIRNLISGEQRLGETKVRIHWRWFGTQTGKQFSTRRKGKKVPHSREKPFITLCFPLKKLFSTIKELFHVFQINVSFPILRNFDPSFRNCPLYQVLWSLAVSPGLLPPFPGTRGFGCLASHSVSFLTLGFLVWES